VLFDRVRIDPADLADEWPFTLPAISALASGLTLTSNLAVVVGENGSGKSTLIEAIAERYGLDVRGGHGARRYASAAGAGPLGSVIQLTRTPTGLGFRGKNAKGFFLRAETAHKMLEFMSDYNVPGYGDEHSNEISHGESYLQVLDGRFSGPGLYLLDEAEGPLSFFSTLVLVDRLVELAKRPDSQVIYATHSPLVAAAPGAQLIELSDEGITERSWDALELVPHWRRFLQMPGYYLGD
jgi:predicted ATPase